MEIDGLINWIVAAVVGILAWSLNKLHGMNERLVRVEAVVVGTEAIRSIIKDEVGHLHDEIEAVQKSVDELSRNVARRRREDNLE